MKEKDEFQFMSKSKFRLASLLLLSQANLEVNISFHKMCLSLSSNKHYCYPIVFEMQSISKDRPLKETLIKVKAVVTHSQQIMANLNGICPKVRLLYPWWFGMTRACNVVCTCWGLELEPNEGNSLATDVSH